ncbi:hypothetical protein [Aurantiacibacter sediminis]|uniref:Uncharacterized protein n=1 Tax=Aurantiacibacter sediminis TaxID=2793064 RepID=A0ABS0N5K2_9SPHN|nr:hypothetical protein [Aurantiacibacter sediminis]MBH5323079.1 hypothetical protein [Aurantiacibacter sediminis]
MNGPLSLRKAAIGGFLYAVAMCIWRYVTSDDTLDVLSVKFAVYFAFFTTGFWILYNLFATWKSRGDD